jgi:hypothetical protein
MNRGNDGPVWEGNLPFLKRRDRYIVAELSAQLVGFAWHKQLSNGDQFPIAISVGDFDSVDRGRVFTRLPRRVGHVGGNAGQRRKHNQQEGNSFHDFPHLSPPFDADSSERNSFFLGVHVSTVKENSYTASQVPGRRQRLPGLDRLVCDFRITSGWPSVHLGTPNAGVLGVIEIFDWPTSLEKALLSELSVNPTRPSESSYNIVQGH